MRGSHEGVPTRGEPGVEGWSEGHWRSCLSRLVGVSFTFLGPVPSYLTSPALLSELEVAIPTVDAVPITGARGHVRTVGSHGVHGVAKWRRMTVREGGRVAGVHVGWVAWGRSVAVWDRWDGPSSWGRCCRCRCFWGGLDSADIGGASRGYFNSHCTAVYLAVIEPLDSTFDRWCSFVFNSYYSIIRPTPNTSLTILILLDSADCSELIRDILYVWSFCFVEPGYLDSVRLVLFLSLWLICLDFCDSGGC